jgi:ataxin-3
VVDDEDAELQAALRASLEGLPSGFIVPSSPPITPKRIIHTTELSRQREREDAERAAAFQRSGQISSSSAQDWDEDEEEEDGDEPSRAGKGKVRASVGSPPPVEESLSMDEIRRRRLARFGGS